MKCFVKYVNVNHIMPTRYGTAAVLELKGIFRDDLKANETNSIPVEKRNELAKKVRELFITKY